ncbi:MAG TPA: hypothetical protein VFE60_00370 [Roseiarcus sp.]|jgi:transposase|nr:hypothetical protein [Roseiarcus sp.]
MISCQATSGSWEVRAPTAQATAADIVKFAGEGVKREDIAARLGVGIASVYRVLAVARSDGEQQGVVRMIGA